MRQSICVQQVQTRRWYVARWKQSPPGHKGLEGKLDLLTDADYAKHKDFLERIKEVTAQTCATGIRLGLGRVTEKEIEVWVKDNAI